GFGQALITFPGRSRVGMARTAIAAERLVWYLGHMRPTHDDGRPGGANRVSHPISLGDHAGHSPDTDEADLLLAHELRNVNLVHGSGVTVNQQHLVAGRSKRLKHKHPKMR